MTGSINHPLTYILLLILGEETPMLAINIAAGITTTTLYTDTEGLFTTCLNSHPGTKAYSNLTQLIKESERDNSLKKTIPKSILNFINEKALPPSKVLSITSIVCIRKFIFTTTIVCKI